MKNRRGRPGLWERVANLWPSRRRRLLDALVEEVERGAAFPMAALQEYERRTCLLPWRPILPPSAGPTYRLLLAAAARRETVSVQKLVDAPARTSPRDARAES